MKKIWNKIVRWFTVGYALFMVAFIFCLIFLGMGIILDKDNLQDAKLVNFLAITIAVLSLPGIAEQIPIFRTELHFNSYR